MTTPNRPITTDLHNILSLVACRYDYGHVNQVISCAFADLTGWVTDEEIEAFVAAEFLTPRRRSQGYGEEDAEEARETIREWRSEYCKRPESTSPPSGTP